MRLLLVNPNTSAATTQAMLGIAREGAPAGVAVGGLTAPFGESLITTEAALTTATEAVVALLTPERIKGFDGVIVAAFGDPGLDHLQKVLPVPVTGIAEASMAEAAAHGSFAVATTTPDLAASITRSAVTYGHGSLFLGVVLTPGDPHPLMADGTGLVAALEEACWAAISDGAQAIVIGGGPLAVAARTLRPRIAVPIIEPVPAALRLAVTRSKPVLSQPVSTAR